MGRIARIFISKTSLTPDDEDAIINRGPTLLDDYDEAHISVVFTWDIPRANQLAEAWSKHCEIKVGGPATGMRGEEFSTGMYLQKRATITSRGCPNKCWFCSVWKRDGGLREFDIKDGNEVCDDNLLACSESHIREVFEMLNRQKESPLFTGGLEAKILKGWHIDLLESLRRKPNALYFAYDTPDDYEPLVEAGKLFRNTYWGTSNMSKLRCYQLSGFPKDTIQDAERRAMQCVRAGFLPFIMLYRDKNGNNGFAPEDKKAWSTFANHWNFPIKVMPTLRNYGIVDEQYKLIRT